MRLQQWAEPLRGCAMRPTQELARDVDELRDDDRRNDQSAGRRPLHDGRSRAPPDAADGEGPRTTTRRGWYRRTRHRRLTVRRESPDGLFRPLGICSGIPSDRSFDHAVFDELVECLRRRRNLRGRIRRNAGEVEHAPAGPNLHDDIVAARDELEVVTRSSAQRVPNCFWHGDLTLPGKARPLSLRFGGISHHRRNSTSTTRLRQAWNVVGSLASLTNLLRPNRCPWALRKYTANSAWTIGTSGGSCNGLASRYRSRPEIRRMGQELVRQRP